MIGPLRLRPACGWAPSPSSRAPSPAELLDGEEGFALSQGVWQKSGWRELDDLRK